MRYREITEAPIGDWTLDPNFDQNEKTMLSKFSGYEREQKHWPDADKAAIKDENVIQRIRSGFLKTPFKFNLYFYQSDNPNYDPILQQGHVDLEWVTKRMGEQTAAEIAKSVNDGAITILMTNNLSDEGWISLRSPWLMAHRMAHALIMGKRRHHASHHVEHVFEQFIYDITRTAYGIKWPDPNTRHGYHATEEYMEVYKKLLGHVFGTMRSARNKKLVQGSEWIMETFAQYLITGNVKLNPLPSEIHAEEQLTTDPVKLARAQKILEKFPGKVKWAFRTMLSEAMGEIWVI